MSLITVIKGVASANLGNSNLTLTSNRTVTGAGFSLTFTGQSTYSIVSPSSSLSDTAFSVRNNTDTADLAVIRGNGRADFYGDIYARSEKVYLQDLWSLYFNYNAIQITSGITYKSRGEVGIAYTQHNFDTTSAITTAGSFLMKVSNGGDLKMSIDKDGSLKTVSPSASVLDTAFTVRNNTDTDYMFRQLGNGEWRTKVGSHACGFSDYFEVGNGFPVFLIDSPSSSLAEQRFRIDGVTISRIYANSSNKFVNQVGETQTRDITTNFIQTIKNTSGEWLFTLDSTGLETPETGVRAKFYGTVKTVSPSASSLDTAWVVRNNTDTDYLFTILADGTARFRVGQDFYLQGGSNVIMRWETNGSTKSRDYANTAGNRVFESNSFQWRNNSNILLESIDINGRRIQKALNSAIPDVDLGNSEMSSYIDESLNLLIFKVKYSSGVVKTTSLTLV